MQLFSGPDTFSARKIRLENLIQEINTYTREYVLNANDEELISYLVAKYGLQVPRVDFAKRAIVAEGEAGRGSFVTISFPYEGSPELLSIRPTTCTLDCPEVEMGEGEFRITYSAIPENRGLLRYNIDRDVRTIESNLKNCENDWKNFDDELRGKARLTLQQRREKIAGDIRFVENLGLPIRRRSEMPSTYPAPAVRRKPPAASAKTGVQRPDPSLEMAEYEHILEIVSNMVKVMERSPRAFAHMEEEHLRDHILVHLNGHYEGQATGETFNFEGKTDILIRAAGGNIFIAECKFWRGGKAYLDAIDQLLRYITWRDTKTAIILFNRQKDFTSVLAQIPGLTSQHPKFLRQVKHNGETAFRFVMKNANDPGREFLMTVLGFDVPS